MRVAFVMPGVGVVRRGAEAFVVELCQGLGALPGFEVHLFCRGPAPVPHTRIRAVPRDQPLIGALYRATRLGRKALDSLFLDPLSIEWATAALSALPHLWRGGFDAVVMEGGLVGARLCRLLRRRRGVPFVDIAHGVDPKWEGAFARQRPDRVVTFTAAAAAMVRREAPDAAIAVIPHGIDLERWRRTATGELPRPAAEPPPGQLAEPSPASPAGLNAGPPAGPPEGLPHPRVLCAGAVDALKRMHLAVEAVARLPSGGSLTVLGEGPDAAALDRLAAERLGAGRYLRRVVPRDEMPAWYGAADCFTLPSRTESFGLVYLEALACGLPVVAPDDAVRREVIGDAGLLCEVTDAAAYSGALAAALARDWGELPRRRAERFPIAATVTAYAELLTSLRPAGSVAADGNGNRPAGRPRP
jgi:glycosyltransferase involved in cell wall biosynthesis